MEEVPVQEVSVHQMPVQEDVYRLEMVTPSYVITFQPIFSPSGQWLVPLMQWEMTPQDTYAFAHVAEPKVAGHKAGGDECRRMRQGEMRVWGDDGGRGGR